MNYRDSICYPKTFFPSKQMNFCTHPMFAESFLCEDRAVEWKQMMTLGYTRNFRFLSRNYSHSLLAVNGSHLATAHRSVLSLCDLSSLHSSPSKQIVLLDGDCNHKLR